MKISKEVKSVLWSYDTNKMSLSNPTDRFRTIINVLNFGDMKAIEWLWQNFKRKEIKEAIKKSFEGEWTKPSLNLWSMILQC